MRKPDENKLPEFIGNWPPDVLERYKERAAIMEYDGGLSRWEAESRAEESVRLQCDAERQMLLFHAGNRQ
ncbi:hypothetical protein LLH00_05830 [bacterium]|nr:hypothetical protein [bacterium]